MINIFLFLLVGGLVGWAASKVMGTDAQQGVVLNVVVGVVGALLAGFAVSPLVGVGDITEGISVGSVLVSLAGACLLLFLVGLVTGRRAGRRRLA